MNNVYLINGAYYHLIEDEINKIIKENDDIVSINYNDYGIDGIITEASYYSLGITRKVLIIKNCSIFNSKSDDNSDLLLKYLDNPNKESIIIFVCDSVDSRKKIVKKIKDDFKYIEIPKIDYKNVYDYIERYLKKNNFKIEYNASKYLVNTLGVNIDLIINELDKLMLYYNKPTTITYDDTVKICSRILDNNNFHFLDACINKEYDKALNIYKDLKTYKVDDGMLIIMLYKEYKKLFYIKKYTQMHYDINKIGKELTLQPWQVEKAYNSSLNYNEKELLQNIKLLGELDKRIKCGNMPSDLAIHNFLMNII